MWPFKKTNKPINTSSYQSIDWQKVQTIDDIKAVLEAIHIGMTPEHARKYGVEHLLSDK